MRQTTKRALMERKALSIISSAGDTGILQTELWKKMGVSSREGSRICSRLESWGLVRREKFLYNGRWTYRIISTRNPPKMDSILGAPCITCPLFSKCAPGNDVNPERCDWLDKWIMTVETG
ncbi:MAG: hypothetical protein QW201_00500 [Thermoproteota archaeon]